MCLVHLRKKKTNVKIEFRRLCSAQAPFSWTFHLFISGWFRLFSCSPNFEATCIHFKCLFFLLFTHFCFLALVYIKVNQNQPIFYLFFIETFVIIISSYLLRSRLFSNNLKHQLFVQIKNVYQLCDSFNHGYTRIGFFLSLWLSE